MKFVVERLALAKMVALTRNGERFKADKALLRLWACAGRVFVEAQETTCGLESLVLEDGSCVLGRKRFHQLLKSYPGKRHLSMEADAAGLRIGGFSIGLISYSPHAIPPGDFQTFATRWDVPTRALDVAPSRESLVAEQSAENPADARCDGNNGVESLPGDPDDILALARLADARLVFIGTDDTTAGHAARAAALADWLEHDGCCVAPTVATFATASVARSALEASTRVRVAVVVTDFSSPGECVLTLISWLVMTFPRVRVLLCTISRGQAHLAFARGAFGVLREPATDSEFRHAISRLVCAPDEASLATRWPATGALPDSTEPPLRRQSDTPPLVPVIKWRTLAWTLLASALLLAAIALFATVTD